MTGKTDEPIAAEVAALNALKECPPGFTLFDDDNHAAIDTQCAVLTERMSHDNVYKAFGNEDHEDFEQHILDAALGARHWMWGPRAEGERSPSEGWSGIEAGT